MEIYASIMFRNEEFPKIIKFDCYESFRKYKEETPGIEDYMLSGSYSISEKDCERLITRRNKRMESENNIEEIVNNSIEEIQEVNKSMRENKSVETVSGKPRYGQGVVETIVYIESMMDCWVKNGVNPVVARNLTEVLKYLSSRLGVKDDVKVELGKAMNYLYRAIHGEWMEK